MTRSVKQPDREKISYRALLRLYKVFGRHYKKHWQILAAAYVGLLLTILVTLLLPWPLKLILDYVILQNPLPAAFAVVDQWFSDGGQALLLELVLLFILLRFLHSMVTYLHKVGLLSASEKITTDIRERIFAHLQRLSLSFHESTRSGDLIYRLTEDINDIKIVLVQFPDSFFHRLVMILSHVGLMLFIEWRLALVAVSVIPVMYYFNRRIG
ncbi:MAG TPA: ABC transporter transmembrane domain-containing protein, partial [bacterium]